MASHPVELADGAQRIAAGLLENIFVGGKNVIVVRQRM